MGMMFVWCVLALLTLAPVATGTVAGIMVRVTQTALDNGRQVGVNILEEMLKNFTIPYNNNVNITGLHYSCLRELKSELKFIPGKGIRLSAEDGNVSMHGSWRLNAKIIRLISLVTSGVKSSVKFIEWIFPDIVAITICSEVNRIIADYKNQVLDLLHNYTGIDFSVVGPPIITNTSLDLALKGEPSKTEQRKDSPSLLTKFPFPSHNDQKMLYVAVSALTINSAASVLHNKGVFSFEITDEMIPTRFPFRLSSKTFGAFIPSIPQNYPDQLMKLLITTDKHPIITIDENNASVQVSCTVSAYVKQSVRVFELSLEASASAHLTDTEHHFTGAMTLDKLDVNLKYLNVGQFEVAKLKEFLKMVMTDFMIPIFNAHFQDGFSRLLSFITQSLSFPINTEIHILKDYLLIETDVNFTGQLFKNETQCI